MDRRAFATASDRAEFGWRINGSPPTYEQLHVALLAGLWATSGANRPRRIRPTVASPVPGRTLDQVPSLAGLAVCAQGRALDRRRELIETSRLFARTVAGIEPGWLEQAGTHC